MTYFALSALEDSNRILDLGRWPRLLHFAPLALLVAPHGPHLYSTCARSVRNAIHRVHVCASLFH